MLYLSASLLHKLDQGHAGLLRAPVHHGCAQCGQVLLEGLQALVQPPSRASPRLEQPLLLRRPDVHRDLQNASLSLSVKDALLFSMALPGPLHMRVSDVRTMGRQTLQLRSDAVSTAH